MFKNPASSIQVFSSLFLYFGAIAGAGLIILGATSKESSIGIIIAGIIMILCSIVVSLFMQAFGVLCEKIDKISEEAAKTTTLVYYLYSVVNNNPQSSQTTYEYDEQQNSQTTYDYDEYQT